MMQKSMPEHYADRHDTIAMPAFLADTVKIGPQLWPKK